MASQFIDPKFIYLDISMLDYVSLFVCLSISLLICLYLSTSLFIYLYVCIQYKHSNINESIYLHPGRLTAGSPTAITHLERKMIWTKPPGNDVQNVNLQGCI